MVGMRRIGSAMLTRWDENLSVPCETVTRPVLRQQRQLRKRKRQFREPSPHSEHTSDPEVSVHPGCPQSATVGLNSDLRVTDLFPLRNGLDNESRRVGVAAAKRVPAFQQLRRRNLADSFKFLHLGLCEIRLWLLTRT